MKNVSFLLATGASALCLLLGIWLFVLGGTNQGLQNELQKLQQEAQTQQQSVQGKQQQVQAQQEQINAGKTISEQVGPALLQDMARISVKNDKMKAVLKKHGYNVELKPDETKAGATPTPAP